MLMRYVHLVLVAATAATAFSQSTPESDYNKSNDVTWLVSSPRTSTGTFSRKMDSPASPLTTQTRISRLSSRTTSQEYSPMESSYGKFLGVKLCRNDYVTASDACLAFIDTTTGDELDIELDIIQETIKLRTLPGSQRYSRHHRILSPH
jgi:hypothetical protein